MANSHSEKDNAWRGLMASPVKIQAVQPFPATLTLDMAATSSSGAGRPYNTDHYLALRFSRMQETVITSLASADLPPRFEESAYALLVADGLAGQSGGARASRLALSTLAHLAIEYGQWNVRVAPETISDIVNKGEFLYRQVNDAMRHARRSDVRLADMATSLTAAYISGADLFFAHVGHSRAFLFRGGVLTQLTKDHTVERSLAEGPHAWPDESTEDDQHVVTESIGGSPCGPDVTIEHLHLWNGDRVLLSTNGLTDVVGTEMIASILSARRRPADECQRLVDAACEAGGKDDVTVLLADYRAVRASTAA
jgi:protein phosphatase